MFWIIVVQFFCLVFFFSSRRRHTRCLSDWSSDVCSSDLGFQMRVAANSLAILEREARLGPAADAREQARLVKLLGRDGTVDELNRVLAHRSEERRVGKECRV